MIKTINGTGDILSKLPAIRRMERGYRHNWIVNIVLLVVCTIGLNLEVVSLLQARPSIGIPWPWKGSEYALVLGLSLIIVIYGVYMTLRQRQLWKIQDSLENARLDALSQVQRYCNRLVAIGSASQVPSSKSTPQDAFDSLTQICAETFHCDQVSLMLLIPGSDQLEVRAAIGHANPNAVRGTRQRLGEGVAGWVAESRKPVILGPDGNLSAFKAVVAKDRPIHSAMVVPILVRDELMGVLCVSSRSAGQTFTEEDIQALLVFSWNAATCIRHAEQAEWMRQTIQDLQAALQQKKSDSSARYARPSQAA